MGALALGPRKAGGSRTVEDWRPGGNLGSLSAGAGTQPILYKDGASTTLGQVFVSPVSHGHAC